MGENDKQGVIKPRTERIYFIQWLRIFLIALVIAHHAGQPYGPTGGDWPIDDPASSNWLGPFFTLNAAFFMGLFFLLSGYFVSSSYDRKGGLAFVRGRIIRLGIPLVLVAVFVFGLIAFLAQESQQSFIHFLIYQYIGEWQIEMGPLWFLAQLLALSIIYAIWRSFRSNSEPPIYSVPKNKMIFVYTLALGVAGMVMRAYYPQDYWVKFFGFIPAEVVHLPQYWSLFIIGIIAGRGHWLSNLPPSLGSRWFIAGILAFAIAVVARELVVNLFPADTSPILFLNIFWGLLEAFVCVGLIMGLLTFFRTHFSENSKWLSLLDQNVYGVYILHVFLLVAIQGAILDIALPALVKFAIATILGLIISFINVALFRLIPGVKRVI